MSDRMADHQAWLAKAEEDWLCIRNELQAAQKPWSVLAFLSQQAAEKHLKAFLVARGHRPPRTHDLVALLEAYAQFDPSLASLRADCAMLTDYPVDIRYPDVPIEVTEQLGREAVAAAERICAAIRARLASQ